MKFLLPLLILVSCKGGKPESQRVLFQITPEGNLTWNDPATSNPVTVKDLKSLPEEFPPDMAYPGAKVLHGGMTRPGGSVTAVFETPDPTDKVVRWYSDAMAKKSREYLTQYGTGHDISLGFGDHPRSKMRGSGFIKLGKNDAGATVIHFILNQDKRN